MSFDPIPLHQEITLRAVRSSGKGGQHVNKVSTRVELHFNVLKSSQLTSEEKEQIVKKLKNRISSEGELILVSQAERSQLRNKKNAIQKFNDLITQALEEKKARIPTKISKAKSLQRLEIKKLHAQKKQLRKNDWE
jgi:ribosome-associated protein